MKNFKEQCVALRQQGHTLSEIVHLTGRPKTTVYFHIQGIELPPERVEEIRNAAGKRMRFYAAARKGKSTRAYRRVQKWTPSSVLLLAHLLFDGEIQRGVCTYNNRSEALTERFIALISEFYDYAPAIRKNAATGVIRVSYFNVALAAHLKERALALLSLVESLPRTMKRAFLRAFFDDEGCMDFRPTEHRRQVRGYQKDMRVLRIVQKLLSDFSIEARIIAPNEIVVSSKDNLCAFEREVGFSPGVTMNGNRSNSRWKRHVEKRELLRKAIESFQN
jgi:hypothetical protein